ncbi:MAG: hypothetical protein HOH77_15330 [Candidatus Latescibacteria bacterium]|nr:hypothetical protein [Candidatus Latescibacterota bacterium]
MFRKTVALMTAICFTVCNLGMTSSVWAEKKDKDDAPASKFTRTIMPAGKDGWSIVDMRSVKGTQIILSPLIGEEMDLEESNRYALFQGGTTYTSKVDMSVLRIGVSGFQSAEFMKQENGDLAIKVKYRSGPRIQTRLVKLKDDNELRRLREYIEHFDDVIQDEYTIADSSAIAAGSEYPKYTDKSTSFEERRPRFPVQFRMAGEVKLKDGKKLKGEFVPVYEDGRIFIETDLSIQKVAVDNIDQVRFYGERGSNALGSAIIQGVGGAAMGALTGAFAAWQANADVKETAVWAAAIFGIFGFVTGLIRGAKATQSGETYQMGPVEGEKRK